MTAPEIVLPVLFTDEDGRARWREQAVSLRADSPQVWLSALAAASGQATAFMPATRCRPAPRLTKRYTATAAAKAAASRCARCSCAGRWRDEGFFRSLIDSARS